MRGHNLLLMKGYSINHAVMGFGDMQDPPEYYDPPGGLLAFEAQLGNLVNESVITGEGMKLEDYRGHFNLVNAQLTQVLSSQASVITSIALLCACEGCCEGNARAARLHASPVWPLVFGKDSFCNTLYWTVCRRWLHRPLCSSF